jgi:hypothetical protein
MTGWIERLLRAILGDEGSLFFTGRSLRGGTGRTPRS